MIDLIALRHDLHQNPEVGFDLTRTAQKVADILQNAGLAVTQGVGQSGVIATLVGDGRKSPIGFRADMDALPIKEANSFEYKSNVDGKFHGCGHDGHTVMLLGVALELAQAGAGDRTIQFIFQPNEENGLGAQAMIDDGVFDRFGMDSIYGMHNFPGMELGTFATQSGPFCAFEDNFEIHITGVGGHASMPEQGIDPLIVGANIVTQLQTIVSRNISAKDHAVISVTEFITDGSRNIIPSKVEILGDCRGFSDEVSNKIQSRMRQISQGIASAFGARVNVEYSTSFRPLINDHVCTTHAINAASSVGAVSPDYGRVGFSEDFAAFLQHKPGCFVLMGNGVDGSNAMPLHNPNYDFNDQAIDHGIAYWKALAHHVA